MIIRILLFVCLVFLINCKTPQSLNRNTTIPEPNAINIESQLRNLPDSSLPQIQVHRAGENGELITPIYRNQPAPYNGVLLNGAAVAYLQTEYNSLQQRCRIEHERIINQFIATYNANIQSLRLALTTQNRINQEIIQNRNREIEILLRNNNSNNNLNNILLFSGGILLGASITIGAVLIVNHFSSQN